MSWLKTAMPYYHQHKNWTCGPASLRMLLACIGIKISEEKLAKLLGTNKEEGTETDSIEQVLNSLKVPHKSDYKSSINDLESLLKSGYKILLRFYDKIENEGHFAVLVKIQNDRAVLFDPWYGPKHSFDVDYFSQLWQSEQEDKDRWFVAVQCN